MVATLYNGRMAATFYDPRLAERYWRKIVPEPMSGCWLWIGAIISGRGTIRLSVAKAVPAHRLVYSKLVGEVTDGIDINRRCKNSLCCNPDHMTQEHRVTPDELREYKRQWTATQRATKPEFAVRARKNGRSSYRANAPKARARSRQWTLDHPEWTRAYAREWGEQNPEAVKLHSRRTFLKVNYGLTIEDLNAMLASQKGQCLICSVVLGTDTKTAPHIDHDHETGRVRGVLCVRCNVGLGSFRDNPDWLRIAAEYVERSK